MSSTKKQSENSDEILIRIPRSVWDKQEKISHNSSQVADKLGLWGHTNINIASGKRNSEHGLTEIQTLAFAEIDQHQKIIELLVNSLLHDRLHHLLSYIYSMGRDNSGEKRYFAAVAVVKLAAQYPFINLKEQVIGPWARDSNRKVRNTAARTLVGLLRHEKCRTDVFNILKYWVGISNLELVDTALQTYYQIAQSYPTESIDATQAIFKNESLLLFYPQAIDIIEVTYTLHSKLVIERLYQWFKQEKSLSLIWMAGLSFLMTTNLKDVAKDITIREKAVDIIYNLWDNPKVPLHRSMQELTTITIHEWANEAIKVWGNNDIFTAYQNVFHNLYRRYTTNQKNRLEFHLRRWQKVRDRKSDRQVEAERANSNDQQQTGSFLALIPLDKR